MGLVAMTVITGILYVWPVLLPFLISEQELALLNERPFFIAFGLALVIGIDLMGHLKSWLATLHWQPALTAIALPFSELLLVVGFFTMSGPQLHEYGVGEAVLAGCLAALWAIAMLDLAQAILALDVAHRRSLPDLRPDMLLVRKGEAARVALGRGRRRLNAWAGSHRPR
jgi:hypothetical protein